MSAGRDPGPPTAHGEGGPSAADHVGDRPEGAVLGQAHGESMALEGGLHLDGGLLALDRLRHHGHPAGDVLGAEDRVVPTLVEPGQDAVHLLDELGREEGQVPVGAGGKQVALLRSLEVQVVKVHHRLRGSQGRGLEGADDVGDLPGGLRALEHHVEMRGHRVAGVEGVHGDGRRVALHVHLTDREVHGDVLRAEERVAAAHLAIGHHGVGLGDEPGGEVAAGAVGAVHQRVAALLLGVAQVPVVEPLDGGLGADLGLRRRHAGARHATRRRDAEGDGQPDPRRVPDERAPLALHGLASLSVAPSSARTLLPIPLCGHLVPPWLLWGESPLYGAAPS